MEQESRHKDLVCNQRRRSLYTPHVLTKLLLLLSLFFFFLFDNSAHCSDIVWSNELVFLFHFPLLFLYLWLINSFSFFFFLLLSFLVVFILCVFFSFAFLFSFWRTPLNHDNRSFAWKTLLFSHPRVRLEISILGQVNGKKSMFGSKGLQTAGHNVCRDICLANGSERRECPNHFHKTHIMITRNWCKINHSTHPWGHSNIRLVAIQTLRLRVCFHIQAKPVFQRLLFYQVIQHPSPFWHSRKSFVVFTL